MEIQIYALAIDRDLGDEERECLLSGLPYLRYQRLIRTRESKQNQAMCAYGLLRYALRELYGLEELPEIAIAAEGKPSFRERGDIQFNLSHTNGAVVCALHDQPVGVDIEQDREAAQTILHYYHIDRQEQFWQMWVQREATAKCHGRGSAALCHWNRALEAGVACRAMELFDGYYAAVASRDCSAGCACHIVTLDELFQSLMVRV